MCTARYTAYSLALELGWSDVDAMLETMTASQYKEWLAFFKIRNELQRSPDKPQGGYGTSREAQERMSGDILRFMDGYQKRREQGK